MQNEVQDNYQELKKPKAMAPRSAESTNSRTCLDWLQKKFRNQGMPSGVPQN
jgi:hypothetical protein